MVDIYKSERSFGNITLGLRIALNSDKTVIKRKKPSVGSASKPHKIQYPIGVGMKAYERCK
jgi:hypothetical protein